MHKAIILLVKATDKDEALEKVSDFMEPYGDGDVWDWYAVGGRWSGVLANKKEYDEWANTFIASKNNGNIEWVPQDILTENATTFETKWKEMGFKGHSPYFDHYKLGDGGGEYDAIPLSECIDIVKENWLHDIPTQKAEVWKELVEAKEKEDKEPEKYGMSGYYAGKYKDLAYGNFSWECGVYNVEEEAPEELPEENEIGQYFAVVVDMHN